MVDFPITDRLIADLRGKLDSLTIGAEASRAFKGNEFAYKTWLERHAKNGHVLHRDSAAAKTARLHVASCSRVALDDAGVPATKGPKLASPTKAAASAFALRSRWKVIVDCDECGAQPATASA